MTRDIICTACPMGCPVTVELGENNAVLSVRGNQCKRGEKYAVAECTNPMRSLTSTVKVKGGVNPLVPVRSAKPVPKHLMLECMKIINAAEVAAPAAIGTVVVENILGTGVDIITTGSCPAKE
ncbi:MAG TPA: DUF1667 domain-containing protein [Clostridiales bacterium]|nr:MAG: hypothetical protein BWY37_00235 [Firmicutes bacterium ADurb.Bin262]HOU10707.1 DUF1667 domain-containing protein [Clostridiales bacterium]HQK73649.1 DUF1667 domain-containing protein [Clostridiales bacterium]